MSKKYIDKIIHPHNKSIISINQNYSLHLFISSSEDGFINIYTLPNADLINSIYINNFYADYVLLSSSPLPCFLIYNNVQTIFKVYSINRKFITEKIINNVYEPKIEKSKNFVDYLKINSKNPKIYKLPYLVEMMENDLDNEEEIIKIINDDLKKILKVKCLI